MNPQSNMLSFMSFFFTTLLIMAAVAPAVLAEEESKVGGNEGWRQPSANETEMYSQWASKQRFHIGDSLRFEYKNDSVLMVDKWGYYHCDLSHPISVFKDGKTVINLERPGPVYFVSGDLDHCKNGQRLMVEVISLHHSPLQPYIDASPAPAPFSGEGSLTVVQELAFFYVFVIVVSINM